VDTVTEQSGAYRVLQPPAFVNQYAAMPSLHVGWDLLVGLTVAAVAAHRWLRVLGRLLPLLMVLAVVVTGNHYLLDVLAGALLALLGLLVADRLRGHRERVHRTHRERARTTGREPARRPDPEQAGQERAR
jgi:membrane-associated phospholipid phosphatase